ncbi:MAG TPA: pyridoxal-phosphate dependent enzyme [Gammaproteobacteria bacterium]|nr:pyridoxal-phosphate dependent enzyme [Gammaproteobacteria bacterium]
MYTNVLEMIGNTPLLEFKRLDAGPCRLFGKLELMNPGGSIKDRIALAMIEAAEARGELRPGATIVEATAGNTGLGLALVAQQKGYRLVLVIPDKMSPEKIFNCRAMGAEVILTRSDVAKGHPEYYQDMAERLARENGWYYINQFGNPDNPAAHERTTAPEIWEQMGHELDAVVVGVGSSGTVTGLTRFFRRVAPHVEIVLADPQGSVLAEYVATGVLKEKSESWLVEGIGEDFIPSICDLSGVRRAYTITDAESFAAARELLLREGIQAGSSTGTLLAAALRYCREQTRPKRVVTFVCDTGNRYLSKFYNDNWLFDLGFATRPRYGDLRDFIGRPQETRAAVTVGPDDTLATAHTRMRNSGVPQLAVLDGERFLGVLTEWDVIRAVAEEGADFKRPVREVFGRGFPTIDTGASFATLLARLAMEPALAVVGEDGRFHGLVTRADVLNHLRRRADGREPGPRPSGVIPA